MEFVPILLAGRSPAAIRAEESAFVLLNAPRHFAIAFGETCDVLCHLRAHRVHDSSVDAGAIEIRYELLERPRYRMPLPDLAGVARAV